MARLELQHADLALYADLSDRVTLTRLTGMERSRDLAGTTVLFEGDTDPTPFRGQGLGRTYNLSVAFGVDEHADMVALLSLLERAHQAPDGRLLLRTHIGTVAGLDPATVVSVFGVTESPLGGRGWQVRFTAVRVRG